MSMEKSFKYQPVASSSQLPSPVSSFDEDTDLGEMDDEHHAALSPSGRPGGASPKRRRSVPSRRTLTSKNGSASDRMDIPLAVALIPPLGTFLTGGDFLKDFLLLLLLFFYLHQLIKLPWELYLASRPRGIRVSDPDITPERKVLQGLTEAELKRSELAYLALSVLSPLVGAALLRYVGTALTGKDYISWFSTGVFVLVTGVRPWRHLTHRLQNRTEELQEAITTFQMKGPDMPTRIAELEKEVEQLKKELATKQDMSRFKNDVDGALDVLDSALDRHEHAVEQQYHTVDERMVALEKTVAELMKGNQGKPHMWMLSAPGSLFNRPNVPTPPPSKRLSSRASISSGRPASAERTRKRRKSSIIPEVPHRNGLIGRILDIFLYPFGVGRRLLWGIVEFLQQQLV
ncbi:hypothetical protein M422DRAFT_25235 [Sphaerobolus stellatus SS14]|nr:hypothetical protein M422DRAFT_25235 [Sphaerobolus stellatus SS14]